MTEWKSKLRRGVHSLQFKFLSLIILGTVIAAGVFTLLHVGFRSYIDTYYVTDERRAAREESYINDLQAYIDRNEISSQDPEQISDWVRRNRYVYLLLYRDDELFFVSGIYEEDPKEPDAPDEQDTPPATPPTGSGITVDYPSREELIQAAEARGFRSVDFADSTLYASLTEFTEYLYYDLTNIVSLAGAIAVLAGILIAYFYTVTRKITKLSGEVGKVMAGDMNHVIRSTPGNDEISRLSGDVERMRSSLLENIRKEHEAIEANTDLITSMSHDIRTPLTVLLGYLDIMKMHTDDETMRNYIRASETTALRLKGLSDDMFRYFLAYGDAMELHWEVYEAATLFEQMLSEHILLLRESGYEVEYTGGDLPADVSLRTDAPNLMRIFGNIFSNLVKYADKAYPVRIVIAYDEREVRARFVNWVHPDPGRAESTGIGLKTCHRIAAALNIGFVCGAQGEEYVSVLTFPRYFEPVSPELPEKTTWLRRLRDPRGTARPQEQKPENEKPAPPPSA